MEDKEIEYIPAKKFKQAIKDHLIKQQFAMMPDVLVHGIVQDMSGPMSTLYRYYKNIVSVGPETDSYYESLWKINPYTNKIDIVNRRISKEAYDEAFNTLYCRTYGERSDEWTETIKQAINICRTYQHGLCPAGYKHPERYSMEYKRMYKLIGNTLEFILKDVRLN